ncbi:hypothetical protein EIP86_010463 [Pleurotus ostreatoroseus]|nr:hypothetical protein EIP86_010463 [Pleurotus ostreatoroseus]
MSVITFFGTTLGQSNAQYGTSDIVVQVIGITFNIIIVRVNNAQGPTASLLQSTIMPSSDGDYPMKDMRSPALTPPAFALRGRPTEITVDVSQVTDTTDDNSINKDGTQDKKEYAVV